MICYVSPDLRAHAVAFFIAPVLMQHDRNRFEIFAYYNYPEKDKFTHNLRQCCHYWRDIAKLSDEEVTRLIRKDGIDILIDLAGHSAHNYHDLDPLVKRNSPFQVDHYIQCRKQGLS